jgi:GNAT superfamily N-acetyltransferase
MGARVERSSTSPRGSELTVTPFKPEWLAPCKALLAGLPEWFASAAVEAYAADLSRFPSWVACESGASAEAGRALGCVTVTAPQREAFELHLLAVAREQHRQGVGTLLLAVAERWARHCKARYLHVKTTGPSLAEPSFERTRAFYLARGFTALFESDRLWGPENPALVLVKSL